MMESDLLRIRFLGAQLLTLARSSSAKYAKETDQTRLLLNDFSPWKASDISTNWQNKAADLCCVPGERHLAAVRVLTSAFGMST